MGNDYITTSRLRLAPLQVDRDCPDLARIGGDPRVAPMMSSLRSPWAEPDVRDWINRSLWTGKLGFRWGIWLKGGPLIGTVGLGGELTASTAYFLDPAYWGGGIATEAMQAFLSTMMARFDLDVVEADHFADNPASGAVLRKLGFQKYGEGITNSLARLEPATIVHYRLLKPNLKV